MSTLVNDRTGALKNLSNAVCLDAILFVDSVLKDAFASNSKVASPCHRSFKFGLELSECVLSFISGNSSSAGRSSSSLPRVSLPYFAEHLFI